MPWRPSAGSVDISFNLIALRDVHGTPLAEMSLELFERPVITATRTMFLTARAAARHMIRRRSGVILMFGGDGGRNETEFMSMTFFEDLKAIRAFAGRDHGLAVIADEARQLLIRHDERVRHFETAVET